jgi:hypothetical protein
MRRIVRYELMSIGPLDKLTVTLKDIVSAAVEILSYTYGLITL